MPKIGDVRTSTETGTLYANSTDATPVGSSGTTNTATSSGIFNKQVQGTNLGTGEGIFAGANNGYSLVTLDFRSLIAGPGVSFTSTSETLTINATGTVSSNLNDLSGVLTVTHGGTGASSFSTNGILVGNGSGAIQTLPLPSGTNTVLTWNGTSFAWVAPTVNTNTGTVTSLGINPGSSKVIVSGSPITTSGTITVDVSEAALSLNNLGGVMNVTKGGTGATTFTTNALVVGNGTAAMSSIAVPSSAGQTLSWTGTAYAWTTPAAGITAVTATGTTGITASATTTSGTSAITVGLNTSGVTQGTYSYPTLTVDQYGRVTSISSNTVANFDGANLGAGGYQVFAGKVGTNLTFRQIMVGTGMTASSDSSTLTLGLGTVPYGNGGTGQTTFTANGVVFAGASSLQSTSAPPSSQISMLGSDGTTYGWYNVPATNTVSSTDTSITVAPTTTGSVTNYALTFNPGNINLNNLASTLDVTKGGTSKTSLGLNSILVGNGTGAIQEVPAPVTAGTVLTWDGTVIDWASPSQTPQYVLPAATTTTLGGVIVGSGIDVAGDGTISTTNNGTVTSVNVYANSSKVSVTGSPITTSGNIAVDVVESQLNIANMTGTLSATNVTGLATVATSGSYTDLSNTPADYTLPVATTSTLGGVIVGSGLSVSAGGTISVSSTSISYQVPAPTGVASTDTAAMISFGSSLPAGAVIDFPEGQTYSVYPGAFVPKAGQTWRLNGCTIQRATQLVMNSVGVTNNGDAYITVDAIDPNLQVGMTIAACTTDRTTAWTGNQHPITSLDMVNNRIYLGGSSTGWGSLAFVNASGSVASLPAGAKVFTAGYLFGTRHSTPWQSTDTYVLNIDPTTLANTNLITAGATITGLTSGDTAVISSLGYQADRIYVTTPVHSGSFGLGFVPSESLQISGTTVAVTAVAYQPTVTRALGTYPYPHIRITNGIFDGNKSNNGTGCRWEYQSEIDMCSSDCSISDIEVLNAIGEGMVLSGRHIAVRNYKYRDGNGNGIHFSDLDGVTGCWDVTIDGLNVNGACKDSAMGHNDGCVTYSNNTRNIRVTNFTLRNSGGVGIGGVNTVDNSETSWLNGKIEYCTLGPWTVTTPASGNNTIYDVKIGFVDVRNCGTSGLFGGGYSGETNPQGKLLDSSLFEIDLYETAMTYGPAERTDIKAVRHYTSKGMGSTNMVTLRGFTNSRIEIDSIDDTTGNSGVYQFNITGSIWDNVDFNCTARGGARGFGWFPLSANASTGIFRGVRSRNKVIDCFELGHMHNMGDYAGDFDSWEEAHFTRGAPQPAWLGFQAFNATTKTSAGKIRYHSPVVTMPKAATGSGGIVNYTVSGGVVNGVTVNTAGSSYPSTGIRFLIANPSGKPAIIDATVSSGALSTFTIVDGGSGYSVASGTQNVGCASVYGIQINNGQQNIDISDMQVNTNGSRPPMTIGSTQTNVFVRGGFYDSAAWSVPSSGPRFSKGYTNGNHTRSSQTVGASPVTFTNTTADEMIYIVNGGTVSLIELCQFQGGTFDTTGMTAGTFHVPPNGQLRVTYTAAPTVTRFGVC